jgi:hypothetical protein
MNASSPFQRRPAWCILLLLALSLSGPVSAAPLTLYSTGFEAAQGFDVADPLSGQGGWIHDGSGGNGITTDFIVGQSAYIGFTPAVANSGLYLWRPTPFTPTNRPLVTFTVDMAIYDSTTTNRDEFRWSIYNIAGERLFSLLFDNRDLGIYFQLDDGVFYETDWGFENSTDEDPFYYTLEVQMNFASNRWSAWLGGTQVVTNRPITTKNAARTFGDADAVWLPGILNKAGDNFMVFDNYLVTADVLPAPPPATPAMVQLLGALNGQQLVRVNGQTNASYALEGTTNFLNWTVLKTNVATSGFFEHLDSGSVGLKQRFYRARWVP